MILSLVISIMFVGVILITMASPAVAERIKVTPFHFINKQIFYVILSLVIISIISTMPEKTLRNFVLAGFFISVILMVSVLFLGDDVKGAKRWMSLFGITIQPSEILKPFYIFITGLILADKFNKKDFPGFKLAIFLHTIVCALLVLQPDFGMIVTYTTVLASQFFLAGIPFWVIIMLFMLGIVGCISAYFALPHVARRIDNFLNPNTTDNYQISKSIEAYTNGGLFGTGPGEGTVKSHLPDSHADFIFAVAGEELGALFCAIIILLFLALILRVFIKINTLDSLYKIYITSGLIILFTLQALFNIGVTLHVFPTKGMTLPLISYGGSSMISFAIVFGMILNLLKRDTNLYPGFRVNHFRK